MHLTNKNIHYTKREYSAHLENQMHTNKYLTKDKHTRKQLQVEISDNFQHN